VILEGEDLIIKKYYDGDLHVIGEILSLQVDRSTSKEERI
jgi:hypothetical protein